MINVSTAFYKSVSYLLAEPQMTTIDHIRSVSLTVARKYSVINTELKLEFCFYIIEEKWYIKLTNNLVRYTPEFNYG
jgi:hypothetical protein